MVLHHTSEGDTANTGHRGHLTWAIYCTNTAAKPFTYTYVCRIAVPTEEKCTYEHCEAVLLIHLLLRTYIRTTTWVAHLQQTCSDTSTIEKYACMYTRGARFNRLRRLIDCLPRIDSQSRGELSNRLIAQ